jgi:hypothetical protein
MAKITPITTLVDDAAHGVGDVTAGQDRADRKAQVALAGAKSLQVRELSVVVGAMLKPLNGVHNITLLT